MFWRFGGYASISTIDSVLDKPDVTLEEVLEESDLLQELKSHNTKLIEFLREDTVFQKLLDYVISKPLTSSEDEDEEEDNDSDEEQEERSATEKKSPFSPVRSLSTGRSRTEKSAKQEEKAEREREEKTRQKHAFVASEILSSEVWSITETLMEGRKSLIKFWDFLRQKPSLDPVTAGYFTKINETLLDKKTDDTIEFIKSLDGIMPAMLQHVDCPMIMDLLLKIISMEKTEGGQGIVDWLQAQDLMPMLLAYLGPEHSTFTQTSAGDFIKAIITISANASQNEQSCIGPNSLTRQLVSVACIKPMIANMLKGGNPLTVGVGIIIEVIRKNNSDYDPEVATGQELAPSSGDPIYLGNLLRQFAIHVPEFMALILSSNHTVTSGDTQVSIKRKELPVAFGKSIEPLGFDRFKTCELMAELLHCSNMGLLNERGSEAYVRQRDVEREKLRAEGRFDKPLEPPSATTEFSEDHDNQGDKSESPEFIQRPSELKKLVVTNNTDEDGFEDVGTTGDLADELRDTFDEPASPLRPSKSRLSLDDEFFDEPLHSPSKPVGTEPRQTPTEHKRTTDSPPTALASDVNKLDIDTTGVGSKDGSKTGPKISITDDLVAEIDAHLSPTKEDSEASRLGHNDKLTVEDTAKSSPGNMSPHSEDTPAPLFTSQQENSQQAQESSGGQITPTQSQDRGDEMWQNQNTEAWAPHIENDVDGRPIVGDFLKMQFVEHRVVPTILDFFFRFPWNNFLHNVVYDVVQQVFNGTMERGYNRALAVDLFTTGRITERVIEGQLRSDEAQARNNLRLGYMGHLTLIAEEVVKFSERHAVDVLSDPVVDSVTERIWTDYVENTLSETRERDNAILGGIRPDTAGGARQAVLDSVAPNTGFSNAGSAALTNAGLNGGGTAAVGLDSMDLTTQSGGNFLATGSLLSGFGSSSDEEDEDMEEIVEVGGDSGSDPQATSTYTPTGFQALSLFSNPKESKDATDNDAATTASSSDSNGNPILTPESSSGVSENEDPSDSNKDASGGKDPATFLPQPLKISPTRARQQLALRLAAKEKERQEEKSGLGANDDTSTANTGTGGGGGIFSPTEGRTSTPDTPAFTAGGPIHERGLHSKRRAAVGSPLGTGMNGTGSGTGLAEDEEEDDYMLDDTADDGEDPWASLDKAAAAAAAEKEGDSVGKEEEEEVNRLADSETTSQGAEVEKDTTQTENSDSRPRSPRGSANRSTMSRLFQSWQGSGGNSGGNSNSGTKSKATADKDAVASKDTSEMAATGSKSSEAPTATPAATTTDDDDDKKSR